MRSNYYRKLPKYMIVLSTSPRQRKIPTRQLWEHDTTAANTSPGTLCPLGWLEKYHLKDVYSWKDVFLVALMERLLTSLRMCISHHSPFFTTMILLCSVSYQKLKISFLEEVDSRWKGKRYILNIFQRQWWFIWSFSRLFLLYIRTSMDGGAYRRMWW